ncbi:RNA polymerase sigma factor [Reichenbachiella agariperforans]|uniref:RNA polymerase sigma factor n=1 Tax=Reichenbachiella agariperforans TaxID=156994 RepID=UPI001C09B965|nr:sigma-70 family RNA polymerase sigma factor [Reichenbachiella agariperforans]MBU2913419.1 sigma-70 family RNA polymerase sigma factor [Reichenbachiella agariperforans]
MIKRKAQILDELLVMQVRNGDQEAFEQLVVRWHENLIYQSFIRTGNREQSQDIVQDVWQWLIGHLHKLEDVSNFGSWIRIIVDRRSIDWLRKQKVNIELNNRETDGCYRNHDSDTADSVGSFEDTTEQSLCRLEQMMATLPAESKLIMTLYYMESHSIQSISNILGIPKGTVKSRLYHTREKLKELLKH